MGHLGGARGTVAQRMRQPPSWLPRSRQDGELDASRKLQIVSSADNGRSIEEVCSEHAISQETLLAWRTATVHGALRASEGPVKRHD